MNSMQCSWPSGIHAFRKGQCSRCGTFEVGARVVDAHGNHGTVTGTFGTVPTSANVAVRFDNGGTHSGPASHNSYRLETETRTIHVLGQDMTQADISREFARIRRENAESGWSDGRVTESRALVEASRELQRLELAPAATHAACPTHEGQSFDKSTGDCSCGSNHHRWASPNNPAGYSLGQAQHESHDISSWEH